MFVLVICMFTRQARMFHSSAISACVLVAGSKQRGLASREGRTGIHTPENQSVEGCVRASLGALVEGLCSLTFSHLRPLIFLPGR